MQVTPKEKYTKSLTHFAFTRKFVWPARVRALELLHPSCFLTDQGVASAKTEARGGIDNDVTSENTVRGCKDGRKQHFMTRATVNHKALTLYERQSNSVMVRRTCRLQPEASQLKPKKRRDLSSGAEKVAELLMGGCAMSHDSRATTLFTETSSELPATCTYLLGQQQVYGVMAKALVDAQRPQSSKELNRHEKVDFPSESRLLLVHT